MAIDINGDGLIALGGTSTTQGRVRLAEDTDNGTNYIELTAPASVTSNKTITFPDETGTVLTGASSIAASQLPAGSVLQVASTLKQDTFSTTSTSYTDVTGLSVSITPSSASNKILVIVSLPLTSSTANYGVRGVILRDSTIIGAGTPSGNRPAGSFSSIGAPIPFPASMTVLDSPSSTSSLTYKVQIATENAAGPAVVGRTSGDSDSVNTPRLACSITVMEIKG